MLDIPEFVKVLFLQDNIRKNLRVHFPNGEMPDIINDHIVSESLNFSETLNSNRNFSFGTAESPTIQFETVGIGNMFGMTIEIALEVDATTLPEEYQTVREDLPFPVYPLPLGTFKVTACPRDHKVLTHRKVTAINGFGVSRAIFPQRVVDQLTAVVLHDKKYSARYRPTLGELLSIAGLETVSYAFSQTLNMTASYGTSGRNDTQILNDAGMALKLKSGSYDSPVMIQDMYMLTSYSGYGITRVEFDGARDEPPLPERIDTMAEELADDIIGFGGTIHFDGSDTPAERSEIVDCLKRTINHTAPRVIVDWQPASSSSVVGRATIAADQNEDVLIPETKKKISNAIYYMVIAGRRARVSSPLKQGQIRYTNSPSLRVTFKISRTSRQANNDVQFNFMPSTTKKLTDGFRSSVFDIEQMVEAAQLSIEMSGKFAVAGRQNDPHLMALDSSSVPQQIAPGMYESCWWDDYDIEPVGRVEYKTPLEDVSVEIGEGRSVYSVASAGALEYAYKFSAEALDARVQRDLVPALLDIAYTPIDLTSRGMPWLEPGDRIEVEADDGTIVTTYLLSRQLRGIQHLTDIIRADGTTSAEVVDE